MKYYQTLKITNKEIGYTTITGVHFGNYGSTLGNVIGNYLKI